MKLVTDARGAWKWFSVQIAAVLAALPMAWSMLPDDVKSYIPEEWRPWIVSALAVAVILGRVVDQGSDRA